MFPYFFSDSLFGGSTPPPLPPSSSPPPSPLGPSSFLLAPRLLVLSGTAAVWACLLPPGDAYTAGCYYPLGLRCHCCLRCHFKSWTRLDSNCWPCEFQSGVLSTTPLTANAGLNFGTSSYNLRTINLLKENWFSKFNGSPAPGLHSYITQYFTRMGTTLIFILPCASREIAHNT
jgi:hypothetical protein